MKELSVREMRAALGHLDQLVDEQGEIVVTRRGTPIARVLPVTSKRGRPSHADLRERMPRLDTPSETLVRAERDER